jgi:hypothetical protein
VVEQDEARIEGNRERLLAWTFCFISGNSLFPCVLAVSGCEHLVLTFPPFPLLSRVYQRPARCYNSSSSYFNP